MTVREVDADKVDQAYSALDEVVSGLFQLELVNNASEMKKIEEGLDKYCRTILEGVDHTMENVEIKLGELNSL